MEPALLALLWSRHYPALASYLAGRPRLVLTYSGYATDELRQLVERNGSRLHVLEHGLDAETRRHDAELGRDKAARTSRLLASAGWADWCAAGGLDSGIPLAAALDVDGALGDHLAGEMAAIDALDAACRHAAVEFAVFSEDVMMLSRTAIGWAREHGVPSLHLAHALPLGVPTTIHRQVSADLLAVFGERGMAPYLDCGVDPSRLRATGNPAWDGYARASRTEARAGFCRHHGLDPLRPIVVFAVSWDAGLAATLGDRSRESRLGEFLAACRSVTADFQIVVKKHPHDRSLSDEACRDLAAACGLSPERVAVVGGDASAAILAADVTVSSHSNFAVESLVAGTLAVNLLDEAALRLGNCFGPEEGIVEVAASELAPALERLLTDPGFRESQRAAMREAAPTFNIGVDGSAARRCAELMAEMAVPAARPRYPWQTLLDVEHADASQYHNWARSQLFELFSHPPCRVLDIGCGAGATGQAIKTAFADAEVWGVEVNRAAADVAATRIDHVLRGRFEDVDLEAAGIAPGSLDTVIVADVLEHMYDPWGVLVRLKPYLTQDAQVIASIPNVRNLVVMEELAKGNWRYEEWGLLDITHIRFFTLKDTKRFFHETGYRVAHVRHNLDHRLVDFYERHRQRVPCDLDFDRMTLKSVGADELAELCAIQFFVRAEPGAEADEDFSREAGTVLPDYALWRAARSLSPDEGSLWEARLAAWPRQPKAHLAILAPAGAEGLIGATLDSLAGQLYPHVAVTIVAATAAPANWADSARLAWRSAGNDLLVAANAALTAGEADWVGIVDAGDRLPAHALLFALEAAIERPDWRVIYGDEDALTEAGEHSRPHFKPDPNLDLLRSYPYVGGLVLLERRLFAELSGFDPAFAGIEEHDLMLRACERVGIGGIGHVAEVLLGRREDGGHGGRPLEELQALGRQALAAHLARLGEAADIAPGFLPLSWRVNYRHEGSPKVSMIVVGRDDGERLERCVESLLTKTAYADWELLVLDAGSGEARVRDFVAGLEARGDARLRAYRIEQTASLAAFHNLLAGQAEGDSLVFLHADAVVLAADWLDVLVSHGRRPGVGAVGPRLLAADGTVRGSAMILGAGGGAEPAFAGLRHDEPGYFGRALLEQEMSALGGGALLTSREAFLKLGGFDESLGVDAAEIDYCLRLSAAGLRTIWTPHTSLMVAGQAAAVAWDGGSAASLPEQLAPRWLQRLARDPAYNPNLRKRGGPVFSVEPRTTLNWQPLPWKPLPRVLAHPADDVGCGQYRIFAPMRGLVAAGRVQGWTDYNLFEPVELAALGLDSIVLQRQTTDAQIELIERHRRLTSALKVYELDDLLINLPARSIHRSQMPADIADRLRRVVPLCDRFVVSTEPLAAAYRGINDDIRVVPNYLERSRWGTLRPQRRQGQRPRVGWVGGIGHTGDLEMIADVVRELAHEVDWIFMGMCPDVLRPCIREFHDGVPFDRYPAKVAALNLDLALAPLEINAFNEAKSHLRLLEYGILGYPVICSDIFPYQGNFPVTRVRNRTNDWVKAIREHIADLEAAARMGDELRCVVERDWMLEDHLDVWLKAWLP